MTATLKVGAAIGTVGMLLMPTVSMGSRNVEIEWSVQGEAPGSAADKLFRPTPDASMLLQRRNTFGSSGAVLTTQFKKEGAQEMAERIDHLGTLSDGWVGEGSLAPDRAVLAWLAAHTKELGTLREASLIPMEDGSVAVRWESGCCDLTAEVRPDLTLYTLVDNLESDELEERSEPLTDAALSRFLAAHGNA